MSKMLMYSFLLKKWLNVLLCYLAAFKKEKRNIAFTTAAK